MRVLILVTLFMLTTFASAELSKEDNAYKYWTVSVVGDGIWGEDIACVRIDRAEHNARSAQDAVLTWTYTPWDSLIIAIHVTPASTCPNLDNLIDVKPDDFAGVWQGDQLNNSHDVSVPIRRAIELELATKLLTMTLFDPCSSSWCGPFIDPL